MPLDWSLSDVLSEQEVTPEQKKAVLEYLGIGDDNVSNEEARLNTRLSEHVEPKPKKK